MHAAALMALKKKKMYETQLEQCENNILRVNEQQMMLENQRTMVETVSVLRDAAHASKSTMSEMNITDVDQVQGLHPPFCSLATAACCGLSCPDSLTCGPLLPQHYWCSIARVATQPSMRCYPPWSPGSRQHPQVC